MELIIEIPVGGGVAKIDVFPDHTVGEVKEQVCEKFGLQPQVNALMFGGYVLDDSQTIGSSGIHEGARLALLPYDLIAGTVIT